MIYRSTSQGIFLKNLVMGVGILALVDNYCVFSGKLSIITQDNPNQSPKT
ncbi:hypothetical protein [Anabaena sp. CS-542/02]|nr:hypothetical protein [Anabaena sp. CS-542/02]